MNEYNISNFIDYCDSMQIVTESIKGINSKYSQLEAELAKINEHIKKEDKITNLISLYKKQSSLIDKCESEVKKESKLGIKDIGFIMNKSIIPLIFASISAVAIFNKEISKELSKGTKLASTALTGASSLIAISDIKDVTDQKEKILKTISKLKEKNAERIKYLEYLKSKGFNSKSEIQNRENIIKEDSKKVRLQAKQMLSKISTLPNPNNDSKFSNMSKEQLSDFMAKDIIKFLKSYVSSSLFKTIYKDYLYMINIRETNYSDPFSITITDYQSGLDYSKNDDNNEWYKILMDVGEMYIKHRFEKWKGIVWSYINTGDGDEGTVYIEG